MKVIRTRRSFLQTAALASGGLLLSGCDQVLTSGPSREILKTGERLSMRVQRALMTERSLAREFRTDQISKYFPVTGTSLPRGDAYKRWVDTGFRDWRLKISGLVHRPLELSLNQLKDMPGRTQITQHQCDEGWAAIAEWTGIQVGRLLQMAGLFPHARYIVFYCMDTFDGIDVPYYESLDLFDAFHPQTILAYGMNGRDVPVANGAPLRLRAELHIGYKNAKYVDRIEVVESTDKIGAGRGSLSADLGYQWYAGM